MNLFKPTRYKVVATLAYALTYIVVAFARIVTAGLFLSPMNTQSSERVLVYAVNWIILAILIFMTSSFIFSKTILAGYSLKRGGVLALTTVLGTFASYLFFEMPRFLSLFLPSLAVRGDVGSLAIIAVAELLLSYVLFSLLLRFMEKYKATNGGATTIHESPTSQ